MESTSVTNAAGVGATGRRRPMTGKYAFPAMIRIGSPQRGQESGKTCILGGPKQAQSLGLASIDPCDEHRPEVAGTGMRLRSPSSSRASVVAFWYRFLVGVVGSLPELPQRLDLHPGTIAFVNRDKSILTQDSVNDPANTLSVLATLLGGSIFLVAKARKAEPGS